MPRSVAVLLALVVTGLTAAASPAGTTSVRVVQRGETVHVSASPSGTADCLFAVSYSNQTSHNWPVKSAVLGKVTFSITIPRTAPLGIAHWSIRCGVTWGTAGTWRIVAAPQPKPTVGVSKSGFSQRPNPPSTGSIVSFGVLLENASLNQDARNVSVLVGFVDAQGRLVGSVSRSVPLVAAGQTYALGDQATLGTQRSVTRVEVSTTVGAGTARSARPQPQFANIRVVPDGAGFVSEVDGEIANTAAQTMASARLSLVVLNAAGAVVGGGTTSFSSPLAAGARALFAAKSGLSAIPATKAATVVVSAQPTYSG